MSCIGCDFLYMNHKKKCLCMRWKKWIFKPKKAGCGENKNAKGK